MPHLQWCRGGKGENEMPNFRRYYIPNTIVFITSVTRDRVPLFAQEDNVDLLFTTMRRVKELHPFDLLAYAMLPDHLHFLMRTAEETNFSKVMQSINWNLTRNYKEAHGITTSLSLWQHRFWDHVIRDDEDLHRHFDYIHYNPVKHEHVVRPEDWAHSTYMFWAERGYYEIGWGYEEEPANIRGLKWE